MPANGLATIRCAAAAGAASKPSSSSAPTTWVASAATTPRSVTKPTPSRRVGRPRAAATSGEIDANRSGRAIAAVTKTTAIATTAARRASPAPRPKIDPNSVWEAWIPEPPAELVLRRVTKKTPSPRMNVKTIPIAVSSAGVAAEALAPPRASALRPSRPIPAPTATVTANRPIR